MMVPLPYDPIRGDSQTSEPTDRHRIRTLPASTPRTPSSKERERLLALGLYYNEPEPAILCTRCGFALKTDADRVSRHLGEKHDITRKARWGLNKLVQSLQLPDPTALPTRSDGSAKHPHLALMKGAACKHCKFRSTSLVVLAQHLRRSHKRETRSSFRGRWLRDHIDDRLVFQSWLINDIHNAWIVKPDVRPLPHLCEADENDDSAAGRAIRRHAEEICTQEKMYLVTEATSTSAADIPPSQMIMMTNWMRRTGWEKTFENAHRGFLVALSELPRPYSGPLVLLTSGDTIAESSEEDETKLCIIIAALDRLFDRCGDTVRHTDVSIRRWLRGMLPDRPYKAPFELVARSHSEKQYRRLLKRCICFWIRFWRLPRQDTKRLTGRGLYPAQSRAIRELWCDPAWDECPSRAGSLDETELNSSYDETTCQDYGDYEESDFEDDDQAESYDGYSEDDVDDDERSTAISELAVEQQDPQADILLRFCSHMTTEDFEDGKASSTLLIYFSAVCGLSPPDGAEFLRPGQYTTHLSGFVYCARLVMLESVLPRISHDYIGIEARPMRGQLELLQRLRQSKMCDGTISPLGEIFSLLAFGTALRQSDGPTFHFEWSDDGEEISWDGDHRLSMDAFRGLVRTALQAATKLSRRLMYDWDPPKPDFKRIRDKLSTSSAGYSFVTDPANGLADAYLQLLSRACQSPIDGLLQRLGSGESSWDIKAVMKYIEGHDELVKMLMLLFHLGSGQGSRISELLTIEHCNTSSRLRGVGIYAGYMFSTTRHHKARLTTNNEFQVARFLPQPIASLAYQYLVFIRRTTYMLLRTCLRQNMGKSLLFTPAAKFTIWKTDTFSRELQVFSNASPGISFDIGARLYRQLSIAITERHVRSVAGFFNRHDDTSPCADPEIAYAWQSGHRPRQRNSTYGLDGAYPDQLQPALLRLYLMASKQWHAFLRLQTPESDTGTVYEANRRVIVDCEVGSLGQKRPFAEISTSEIIGDSESGEDTSHISPFDMSGDDRMDTVNDTEAPIDTAAIQNTQSRPFQSNTSQKSSSIGNDVASSQKLDVFVYMPRYCLAICRFCKHAVLANEVKSHLLDDKHRWTLTKKERGDIESRVREFPGVLQTQEDLVNFKLPSPDTPVLPFIAPPKEDGLRCKICGYVTRTVSGMRSHCREKHRWKPDRYKGFNVMLRARVRRELPWTDGVLCQRLFVSRYASGWFEVCRKNAQAFTDAEFSTED